MTAIEQVNLVIETLQEGRWADHDLVTLISAQGKLAVLIGNVNEMVAEARKEMDLKELHAKQFKADAFLKFKLQGDTDGKARQQSKLLSQEVSESAIHAKYAYSSILGVAEAMRTMIIACQVTIKNLQKDRESTPFTNNA